MGNVVPKFSNPIELSDDENDDPIFTQPQPPPISAAAQMQQRQQQQQQYNEAANMLRYINAFDMHHNINTNNTQNRHDQFMDSTIISKPNKLNLYNSVPAMLPVTTKQRFSRVPDLYPIQKSTLNRTTMLNGNAAQDTSLLNGHSNGSSHSSRGFTYSGHVNNMSLKKNILPNSSLHTVSQRFVFIHNSIVFNILA